MTAKEFLTFLVFLAIGTVATAGYFVWYWHSDDKPSPAQQRRVSDGAGMGGRP
jgi:hypothetical protein